MVRRTIRDNKGLVGAILLLVAVSLVCGSYILIQQRLPVPFDDRYTVRAEFAASTGLVPGLGQPVNVSGVKVGQVASTELRDGRALVSMEIDPEKLPSISKRSHAMLVPRTPLKDLQIELDPGERGEDPLPENGIIPVARTSPPIDSDELTAALDADTRRFFEVLVAEGGRGLDGRGTDLRELFRTIEPTAEQLGTLARALKGRRGALRGLVHELSLVSDAAGSRDRDLARLVRAGDETLGALAAEERSLRTSVRDLPGTLAATRRSLDRLEGFTEELRPTLEALLPATRKLPAALASLAPVAAQGPAILRDRIRPLVREARPLARDLAPTTKDLRTVSPDLVSSFQVLNYVVNELAYNDPNSDDEGYLYWLAWFTNNAASFLSTQDAHGSAWRGLLLVNCGTFTASPPLQELASTLLGALPVCD